MPERIFEEDVIANVFATIMGDSIRDKIPAKLGNPSNGKVELSLAEGDLPGQVYVHGIGSSGSTIDNPSNNPVSSFSTALLMPNKIPPGMLVYNAPVLLVRKDNLYYVDDFNGLAAIEFFWNFKDRVQRSIDIGQIDYGMARPANPPSLRVLISRAKYDFDGTIYDVPSLLSDSLSAHVPSSGFAKAVRIDVKVPDKTLVYTAGSAFSSDLTHEAAFDIYYPKIIPDGQFTSCWVKLYGGITKIQIVDIYHGQELFTKRTVPLNLSQILGAIVTDDDGVVIDDNGEVVWED